MLDLSLEIINSIKDIGNVHVFIEVTSNSKMFNIAHIENLPEGKFLAEPEELLPEADNRIFSQFFNGCASVHFVIHSHPSGISIDTLKVCMAVNREIKRLKPAAIHFESFSLRTLGVIPFLFSAKNIVFTIHDAVPHSGERHWKGRMPDWIFKHLPLRKTYLFYSTFTKQEFLRRNPKDSGRSRLIKMPVYTFYSKLSDSRCPAYKHILFFGRISKYKGVPLLVNAMPEVWKEFPDVRLVIAGNGAVQEISDSPVLLSHPEKIKFINRYISNKELVELVRDSIVVVCPYTDASQSGVLMTTFGLNKPIIATNVGAFSEFIQPGINGFLTGTNSQSISEAIKKTLSSERYIALEKNLLDFSHQNITIENRMLLKDIYDLS